MWLSTLSLTFVRPITFSRRAASNSAQPTKGFCKGLAAPTSGLWRLSQRIVLPPGRQVIGICCEVPNTGCTGSPLQTGRPATLGWGDYVPSLAGERQLVPMKHVGLCPQDGWMGRCGQEAAWAAGARAPETFGPSCSSRCCTCGPLPKDHSFKLSSKYFTACPLLPRSSFKAKRGVSIPLPCAKKLSLILQP